MPETQTLTLTDFLLARIAEDEAAAKRGYVENPSQHLETVSDCDCTEDRAGGSYFLAADPARVLAECEAKRRIVEALIDAEDAVTKYDNDDPNNPPSYWQEWGNLHALRFAAESHAATYADHPDFRAEWAL